MRGVAMLLLLAGCSTQQAVAATATAAAAVAVAAINRAATNECWGSCSNGYVCNHKTGECVLPEELEAARAADPEREDDGSCIQEDDGHVVCPWDPEPTASASGNATAPPKDDACKGLCLDNEVCVVKAGTADCVAR
jgi:hypothetical protein